MSYRHLSAAVLVGALLAGHLTAAKKKKKEEVTQTLEVVPDPPSSIRADTTRLVFHASPLSSKGLLSQQVRDAVKAIWKSNGGATVVKLRAFVAGTGDMRRVPTIISEMFAEKRLPLPVVNVVQVGVLPMDGAQVVFEATSVAKKAVNPHGLAFISGQGATAPLKADQASMPVAWLALQSVTNLKTALAAAKATPSDVRRVMCLSSSLDDYPEVQRIVSTEFPRVPLVIVQVQRAPSSHVVECEVVAALPEKPEPSVQFIQPQGLTASPNFTHVVLVGTPQIIFTTTQLGFHGQDSDVRLAFNRLKSLLEAGGGAMDRVVFSNIYPTSSAIQAKVRAIRFDYYAKERPPASTMVLFEGLPSLDATFGVDVISLPRN